MKIFILTQQVCFQLSSSQQKADRVKCEHGGWVSAAQTKNDAQLTV